MAAAPKYWKGYDTVAKTYASAIEQINAPRDGSFRDGWNRFNLRNKVIGPLDSVMSARKRGEHRVYRTVWIGVGTTGERWCSCGLIVAAPDLERESEYAGESYIRGTEWPENEAAKNAARRQFLDAPGHIDWRAPSASKVARK